MKIFLVINSFGAGGAERSTVELAKFLRTRSVEFLLVALKRKKTGIERELVDEQLAVRYCEGAGFLSKLMFLHNLIKTHRPDIVHSVLYEANLLCRACKVLAPRIRLVQSLVSTPYTAERMGDKRLSPLKFKLVRFADAVSARIARPYYHAITRAVLDHYRTVFPIPEHKSFVIFRGRGTSVSQAGTRSENREPSLLRLINVGRQEFAKGQITILRALHLLRTERDLHNVHLTILGREGNTSNELLHFVQKHEMKNQVSLTGFRTDVDAQLAKADVFVFSSYLEGLGGALIEAFAAGLPCICSDLPALREVVGIDDGALFFPPGDYRALAAQIEVLYRSGSLRQQLASRARERFDEAFRADDISTRMLDMYKRIVASA